MALAIAASGDWEVPQLDVQTICFNADVQEEVHVKTTPGYESLDAPAGRPKVMKLKKSLYAFRQNPSQLVQHHRRFTVGLGVHSEWV